MRAFTALLALAVLGAAAAQSGLATLYPGFYYDWVDGGDGVRAWEERGIVGGRGG